MNQQQRAFLNAFLTEAKGNATKAAILAGYSERTAAQIGSRLLKHPEVSAAIESKLEKHDIRTDAILRRLGRIAHAEPKTLTGTDVIGASRLILQVNGALKEKDAGTGRITVNIGFLSTASTQRHPSDLGQPITASVQVMSPQPQVALPEGSGE